MSFGIEIQSNDGHNVAIPIARAEGQFQVRHDGVLFDGKLYLWEEIKYVKLTPTKKEE